MIRNIGEIKYNWAAGDNGWADDVNHNFKIMGIRLNALIKDRDLLTPPLSPIEGDTYLVSALATGTWATHDGKLATLTNGSWFYLTPGKGWGFWVDDESTYIIFDGTTWKTVTLI